MLSGETPAELRTLANRLHQALGEQYVVDSVLGVGGFAAVFRVHDTDLKRDLAVKVLNPDLLTSSSTRERFQREAETVAKLSHPNVVHVHFIGREDDLLYIGMPCIEGGTLTDLIKRDGALPIDDAIRVITEVASALAHAHKKGVIHRDIKSQNVLMDAESGRCLVTDFGIARTEDSAGTLTSTGMVIGTPAYLSPEQITGERGDHRVDIYALGVLAYEVVTGKLPFAGTSSTAAMMKRFEGPPPAASSVRPEVPAFLDAVIARSLAIEADERFQSADELLAALNAGGQGETNTATRLTAKAAASPRRGMWFAAVTVVTVVALIAIYLATTKFGGKSEQVGTTVAATAADSTFVTIPAGQYQIGNDSGGANSRPAHAVSLSAFRIGAREVTNGDYARFATSAGKTVPIPFRKEDANLPVTGVRWTDADSYCAGLVKNGRLPTEAEWEAAARGRANRITPWDNAATGVHANIASTKGLGPVPVGSYEIGKTPEGVYDLVGNVWEWTSSPWGAYPGGTATVPDSSKNYDYFVIRGGAFNTPDDVARPWYRVFARANGSVSGLSWTGFRCAVSAEPPR